MYGGGNRGVDGITFDSVSIHGFRIEKMQNSRTCDLRMWVRRRIGWGRMGGWVDGRMEHCDCIIDIVQGTERYH